MIRFKPPDTIVCRAVYYFSKNAKNTCESDETMLYCNMYRYKKERGA